MKDVIKKDEGLVFPHHGVRGLIDVGQPPKDVALVIDESCDAAFTVGGKFEGVLAGYEDRLGGCVSLKLGNEKFVAVADDEGIIWRDVGDAEVMDGLEIDAVGCPFLIFDFVVRDVFTDEEEFAGIAFREFVVWKLGVGVFGKEGGSVAESKDAGVLVADYLVAVEDLPFDGVAFIEVIGFGKGAVPVCSEAYIFAGVEVAEGEEVFVKDVSVLVEMVNTVGGAGIE